MNYFKSGNLENFQQDLLIRFANDLATKRIDTTTIQAYIKLYEEKYDDSIVCPILRSILNTYCADYTTDNLNETTLVRDTIDTFLKVCFPNSNLTKSIGADAMIKGSSK